MSYVHHEALVCPLDSEPLSLDGKRLVCPSGHSFDIARQGYVNLLLAQQKRSREPGDSKAMITARSSFLAAGLYAPVAAELAQLVGRAVPERATVVDAGCGEGYYAVQLLDALPYLEGSFVGFDISKWAVQAAASRLPATWLVASNRNIPLQDSSADLLLSLFGFPELNSFCRVLKPAGHLLVVEAGPGHLLELRQLIYPSITAKSADDSSAYTAQGFQLQEETAVVYTTEALSPVRIAELLQMTPHLYRASAAGKAKAAALESLALTVDVRFRRYRLITGQG